MAVHQVLTAHLQGIISVLGRHRAVHGGADQILIAGEKCRRRTWLSQQHRGDAALIFDTFRVVRVRHIPVLYVCL
jgi:hypothetical protein